MPHARPERSERDVAGADAREPDPPGSLLEVSRDRGAVLFVWRACAGAGWTRGRGAVGAV